ncbi:hypothetical protein A11A3_11713 [Alcanivorax hongdengensis A-11-3]|uniref:Lipoprotein n=1 Tax=Alcanivorax hongdengensis A-11-3 TaxID=1177179 RepID=L0WA61_9GAMM|nr:hypothetical protein [Alcanivorax hongdengensis]EKF73874.1 hypothetical protein A11A3_11713 [Alcanivorax hongdengensis A-11-3]
MYRTWMFCFALYVIAGCDNGVDVQASLDSKPTGQLTGTYHVERRCNGLGAAAVDFTPRGQGGTYYLLIRGGDGDSSYAAIDHLELSPFWNSDNSDIKTTNDGLLKYRWVARLTKESGWLDNATGVAELPNRTSVIYDAEKNRFFLEKDCGDHGRDLEHAYLHVENRLVLHDLNLAMAKARKRMLHDANQRYIDQRGNYQGASGANGLSKGHPDRNQHLLNVAALMIKDAEEKVPELAPLVAGQRPAGARGQYYKQELPAYLQAAARAHARWYIDAADIRLDWFHGAYPEGEAAIREGMKNLQIAYLRLASE